MNIMGNCMRLNLSGEKRWVFAGAAGFLVLLVLMWTVYKKPSPLVVVDMNHAIQAPSMMLARSKLTADTQLKIMRRFSTLLPKVITEYGQAHRVTIVSATVLASHNNTDVTGEVIAATIARMKHDV